MRNELTARANQYGLDMQCGCDGSFFAEVAIIAEAPGDKEVANKKPLVGGSGKALWDVLRKYGIQRGDTYITNVSKRQVSFGNDKRHPISKNELEHWIGLLQWELSQLPNLKYVLVLGNMALKALAGVEGITDWRGSVLDVNILKDAPLGGTPNYRSLKAVCTYNPAAVLREPKLELTFGFDCSKLRKVMDGNWVVEPVTTHINPSFDDAMDWIDKMERDRRPVAYDIETISGETACIGLANNHVEAMCINWRTLDEQAYPLEVERKLRRRLQTFFGNREVQTITQNGMFDASWLAYKDRIVPAPHYFDTMLAHHCLYPQLPHNLGYITTQYTTRPFYKNEKDSWREGGDIDSFWRYNGQDCCNTHAGATGMLSELRSQSLERFFFDHVMRLQPHLIRMTVGGILVDVDRKEQLKETLGADVQRLQQEFWNKVQIATGEPDYTPNPKSPKQMSELLFSKLKLVGKGVSTDEENRERMFAHPATTEPKRDVLRALNEFTAEQKFYSTYATTAIDDDNRMRCEYKQTGVQSAPGRLSSTSVLWGHYDAEKKEFVNHGGNLQNQPERAYGMYIADPGYGLGYFDLSQAEARLVGWYANITNWIEQFEKARIDGSYDAHRALASEMFGVPYDEVPTFDRYMTSSGHPPPLGKKEGDVTIRYIAKRCRHGLNYRMGPDRLASVTGLSLSDATTAYRLYHRLTPELQRWWADVEEEVRSTRMLFNALGRRWMVLERMTPQALEGIIAFKPQSSNGDHVSRVIYLSHDDPKWPSNARILLNIHDALICLAPLYRLQTCLSIMKKYAQKPLMIPYKDKGIIRQRELIIPADTKISFPNSRGFHSWESLKKIDIEAAA